VSNLLTDFFKASGDPRNLFVSVLGLPPTYEGRLETIVNDRDIDVVSRNAILLLTALHFEPGHAAVMILHLWYSALIPAEILGQLREFILPLIQDMCQKIQGRSSSSLLSKKWTFGARSLRLILTKDDWNKLLSYFEVPEGLSAAEAQNVRSKTTMAPERKDYVDRALYKLPATLRASMMKFREDGVLLPYGAPRQQFDTPNPYAQSTPVPAVSDTAAD
jgi:Domain of unknown function (DUF4470)